jgi:uncharacterized Zn finger protein
MTDPACPHCGESDAEPIKFTWWGGLIGPKLFHHVRCLQCGKTYNAKTGKSNTVAIIIYTLAGFVIFGVIAFVWFWNIMSR